MSTPSPLSPRFPFPQQRGDPSPSPASLAPPLADFPDFALLPPRQQGTRAACVMGAGNKDAQDPPPWPPGTSGPHLPELFARSSMSGSQRFPALPEPGRRAHRLGHTHPNTTEREIGASDLGESAFPAKLRKNTPEPTHPRPNASKSNTPNHTTAAELRAGHPCLPRASGRPERTDTCCFFLLAHPHLPLPGAPNKAVPRSDRTPHLRLRARKAGAGGSQCQLPAVRGRQGRLEG